MRDAVIMQVRGTDTRLIADRPWCSSGEFFQRKSQKNGRLPFPRVEGIGFPVILKDCIATVSRSRYVKLQTDGAGEILFDRHCAIYTIQLSPDFVSFVLAGPSSRAVTSDKH